MGSFSNLPVEVTFDILCRLPAKSVGMCRCVSKPWRALLSRPQFIRAHLHRSRNARQHCLTFWDPDCFSHLFVSLSNAHQVFDKITLLQVESILPGKSLPFGYAAGSCDGLLLLLVDLDDNYEGRNWLVLNPITRVSIQLPNPPICLRKSKTSNVFQVFGYDPVDNDYKVVAISFYECLLDEDGPDANEITPELVVNVYGLKTGCWKRAQTSHYYDSYGDMQGGLHFVHGCLNWLARRTADQGLVVVGFSLVEEKFFEVPPPEAIDDDICILVVVGGFLCMFDETEVDLWMMKEYGVKESWTKFTISWPDVLHGHVQFMFSVDEENIVLVYSKMSVMYNLKQASFKYLEFAGAPRLTLFTNSFVESLSHPMVGKGRRR